MSDRVDVVDVMGTLCGLAPVRRPLTDLGIPGGALDAWFAQIVHSSARSTLFGEFHGFP